MSADEQGQRGARGPPGKLVARTAELDVVVVLGRVDGLDGAANVEVLDGVVEVRDSGVRLVVGTEDLLGLVGLVGLVDRRDCVVMRSDATFGGESASWGRTGEDGERSLVTRVAEGDARALGKLERVDLLLRDVEGDGHGEEGAVGEAESLDDAADPAV